MIQGANFQPSGAGPGGGGNDPRRRAQQGLQEAIQVLSLRLPKAVGAQSVAPSALLNAQGSGGNPMIDSVVSRVMSRMMPTGDKPPMGNVPSVPPIVGQPSPGESGTNPPPSTNPPSPPVRYEPPPTTPLSSFMRAPRISPSEEGGVVRSTPAPEADPSAPPPPPQLIDVVPPARPWTPPSAPPDELPLTADVDQGGGGIFDRLRRKNQGGDYEPGGGGFYFPRNQPGGIQNF